MRNMKYNLIFVLAGLFGAEISMSGQDALSGKVSTEASKESISRVRVQMRPSEEALAQPEFRYDVAPVMRFMILPVYPYAQLVKNLKGKASVVMLIDSKGRSVNSRVVDASDPAFGYALAAAVDTWVFRPATRAGKPVTTMIMFDYEFAEPEIANISGEAERRLLWQEQNDAQSIVPVEKLDSALQLKSRRPIEYPSAPGNFASKEHTVVEFLVDTKGFVRLPRYLEASAPELGYAAVQAVSVWRFEPPKHGGRPVIVRVRVLVPNPLVNESAVKTR
ncbi:MAG: energy transducer TonB [Opitutae bacterium]|nr:energy transducer TonB [Opitutae bacterium]